MFNSAYLLGALDLEAWDNFTQMRVHSRTTWALLALCAAVAFFAFAYPLYVIRPFRAQGARELAAALAVRSWGPNASLVAVACGLFLFVSLWKQSDSRQSDSRQSRWLPRVAALLLTLAMSGFAILSRINVYELMFYPIPSVDHLPAALAKLDADDMVMAVKTGGHSRAYPIRMMGYHHVVNDWVGGIPLVGTY